MFRAAFAPLLDVRVPQHRPFDPAFSTRLILLSTPPPAQLASADVARFAPT